MTVRFSPPTSLRYETAEFLPRLEPTAWGRMPGHPFATRWFGRAPKLQGVDLMVLSKRTAAGVSEHLVSDRHGHWLAYELRQGRRRVIGSSARGMRRFAHAFGVGV